jgi:hypothetical protein
VRGTRAGWCSTLDGGQTRRSRTGQVTASAHLRQRCAGDGSSQITTRSRILGHKAIAGTIAVSGIYDRFDRLPEIRTALAAWATYIARLVTGDKKHGEVMAFETATRPVA